MRVLVAGASGTLGGPLVRQLVRAGHQVSGITRSSRGADRIAQTGGSAVTVDIMDRDALLRAVDGEQFEAVIHEATALAKATARHSDMAQTNALRTQGTAHLIAAAQATGARRFLTQSIVFGYGYTDHGTTVLIEDSPFGVLRGDAFDPHVEAMVSTEHQAMHTEGIEGIALRYGLLYGADIDNVVRMLRKRMLPVVRGGGEIPFIHHEDAAAATVAALERGQAGKAYNIVDDTPATFRQLVTGIADARQAPRPLVVPQWVLAMAAPYGKALFAGISMRVSNARAQHELSWKPMYPSISDGIRAGQAYEDR
ncbi:NAD-dependent epimerase/dehydratase family protein [Micropruina sonneratiae]|uniref:NAD-dependent epimerase/dehydratase family protein n=1 Tax=Micropruina sonneratiae TaxID=2986940 RepID=UPI00222707C1|nr:NAD(P)-dependent oxidoreductase [Micropruina sp. KQZ13P-5]MCW3159576.1 NAD(P)-dependent oxidoreductase [Micropruina sp. KQZ13P-5]